MISWIYDNDGSSPKLWMDQSFCCVSLCNQVSLHFSFFFSWNLFFSLCYISSCTEMYSIQLTIIVLHVLGNWLIDNTDEAGRLNDCIQKIYYVYWCKKLEVRRILILSIKLFILEFLSLFSPCKHNFQARLGISKL